MPTDASTAGQILALASSDDRIDFVCDAFEEAWLRGDRPNIETYLKGLPDAERPNLFFELLLLEVDYRRRNGVRSHAAEYTSRFPQFAEEIETAILTGGLDSSDSGETTRAMQAAPFGTRRIGHFELLEKIGGGAAGEVWRARDLKLQRIAAVKIPNSRVQSDDELHRFLREGRAAAQLRHPNIVSIYDAGRDGDTAYLVADFIDGPNLCQWLSGQRMLAGKAAELCATLAEALHHAHEHGIVHRDLKPANVILDRDGQPHITDFGLAKWADDSRGMTLQGQLLGTPAYMSPEQACGDAAEVDRRADVFSLGVMLYEMLTQNRPFQGDPSAIIDAIIRQEPVAPRAHEPSTPRDLETICLKALEKDADRRYATAKEMAADLRRYLGGEPILARRASAIEKEWKRLKRRPAIGAMIALGMLSLGSLGLVGKLSRKNRELQGFQTVSLTTDPLGANIVFVPLNTTTGEPTAAGLVRANSRTPVTEELKPGDYLVVAVLDDGRFHEVFRHVPQNARAAPGASNHLFWRVAGDGSIVLPAIDIPLHSVVDEMVQFRSRRLALASHGSIAADGRPGRDVPPFFMDAHEFTYGQYKEFVSGGQWPARMQKNPPNVFAPMPVKYDQAVSYAEFMGKRLPTMDEYDCALRISGLQESENGKLTNATGGDLTEVRREAAQMLLGLGSGIAEWTNSWALSNEPFEAGGVVNEFLPLRQFRLVHGADSSGGNVNTGAIDGSAVTHVEGVVSRWHKSPAIGFRGARSVRPPFFD